MDKELILSFISTIDYVSATINYSQKNVEDEWVKIHRGRAFSSQNQLNSMRKQLTKMLCESKI